MKNNNNINQELKSKEKVKIDNFEYKSFSEISKEFQNCKDVFAKLDYAKQLKKDIIKEEKQFIGMIDRNDLPPEPEEY